MKPLDSITPYTKNAKRHPTKQVEQIAASIKEFGFNQPIVVDKQGIIIVGHGRYEAAKVLGISEVPVMEVDLTDEQAKAYRLADNKLNESDWDIALVIEELKDLTMPMIDLTGFSSDLLLESDDNEDVIPENVPVIAQLGDVWQLGEHRIMCGDSTKLGDVERLMDGKTAEILFTSPPYADMRDYNGDKDLEVTNLCNFIETYASFANYQVINLGLKRKEHEIIPYWDEYIAKAKDSGYKFLAWNVWNRETAKSIGQQSAFFPIAHEFIFVFGREFKDINKTRMKAKGTEKDKRTHNSRRQKDGRMEYTTKGNMSDPMTKITSVLTSQPELNTEMRKQHPAIFPVHFPEEYIKAMTKVGDTVIDPFLGAGTTLIAANKCGRICYGMELDPTYVDVIINRWETHTHQKAQKLN